MFLISLNVVINIFQTATISDPKCKPTKLRDICFLSVKVNDLHLQNRVGKRVFFNIELLSQAAIIKTDFNLGEKILTFSCLRLSPINKI